MKLPSSITLCEVGLRDGLQNEATLLTVHQKVVLLLGLIDAGFKVIEVGSFMHPKAVPNQVYDLCSHVRSAYPECSWWLHFHNTRGMAMANILSALEAGMTRFDSSFGGLGGCPFVPGAAGNISTEDVLHMCEESGIETGIDITKVIALSRNLRSLLGHDMESYILRAGRSSDLIRSNQ